MLQQHFAIRPAFAFFADEVFDRHFDVVEMNFVDLVVALDRDNRSNRDAACAHINQQEADAFLPACYIRAGSDQAKNPVSMLPECGPGFGAIDDIVVAIQVGFGFKGGQIGAGVWLGIALAPPHVACKNIGQETLFLGIVTEGVNNRADHAKAERNNDGCVCIGQLCREDILLDRAPTRAAVLHGPIDACPAFLVKRFLKAHEVVTFELNALRLLLCDIVRQLVAQEGSNLVAKLELFLSER